MNIQKQIPLMFKKVGFLEMLLASGVLLLCLFLFTMLSRKNTWIVITMKITSDNVLYSSNNIPFWLINTVKVGDKELNGLGQAVAEVIKIQSYETNRSWRDSYITLKLNTLFNKIQKKYTFSSKDVFIGGPISVKPHGVLLEGIVVALEGVTDERPQVTKKVITQIEGGNRDTTVGIPPWIAQSIHIGDEIKDYNGKIIAKVLEKRTETAKRITIDQYGNALLVRDPYLLDLYLTLELHTILDKGLYYFRDTEKVKINEVISLFTDKYSFSPIIIEIID